MEHITEQNELELQWKEYSVKMEELMKHLPEMEKRNALCTQLEAAQAIVDQAAVLQSYRTERDFNLRQIQKYREEGNPGTAAYIENQMGYHLGLLRAAEQDLDALLAKSAYTSAEEAERFIASNAPLSELRARVAEFSTAYAETLSKLTELDQLMD